MDSDECVEDSDPTRWMTSPSAAAPTCSSVRRHRWLAVNGLAAFVAGLLTVTLFGAACIAGASRLEDEGLRLEWADEIYFCTYDRHTAIACRRELDGRS